MNTLALARIMEVGMGFRPTKVLLSAVDLGLLTKRGAASMNGRPLHTARNLHPRANPDFFDARVALRLLEREGQGPAARYRNGDEAAAFLDRNSPQNEIKSTGAFMFAELYRQPERLEPFMGAMSGISAGNFQALAETFDFSRYQTLCDVGGASGRLSMTSRAGIRSCAVACKQAGPDGTVSCGPTRWR